MGHQKQMVPAPWIGVVELTWHIWHAGADKPQFSRTIFTLCKCSIESKS